MREGTYRTGATPRELAAAWGIAPGTIETLASEASRAVQRERRLLLDRDHVRAVLSQCLERAQELLASSDPKEQANGAKLIALHIPLVGANAEPTPDLRTMLAGMSLTERRAWLEKQAAAIAAALAELP